MMKYAEAVDRPPFNTALLRTSILSLKRTTPTGMPSKSTTSHDPIMLKRTPRRSNG